MADPYNPYGSYSTPAPGGVGYYPPEDQSQYPAYPYQQPYGTADPQPIPEQNHAYPPQSSSYNLAAESHAPRSHTPTGQPNYLAPGASANPYARSGENLGYYNDHPAEKPRYTPSVSPHPPAVYISDHDTRRDEKEQRSDNEQGSDRETDRGLGSSLAGGAAGYYFGHKKDHGLLGAIGGAILGNFLEDKVKDHKKHDRDDESEHRHGRHGHHHHHHHHRSHSRHSDSGHSHRSHSRSHHSSHSRHRGEDEY
ncbi:uncharacterized protein N7511_003279 [Penicillium nucicola]|uniref:uncharacterized protein n=1 Tax=Penicillium nucicola TaxID=1850975 RepID=UPI002544E760|nr:uncharacterized protein N7511_003279 [Penicillium nucicola]KAJ5771228.1 hypothetical protein N7511_003279 [Penicillium nucicola]